MADSNDQCRLLIIVYEHHCHLQDPETASVWAIPGNTYDDEKLCELGEFEGAVKLVGPVASSICDRVITATKVLLTSLGYQTEDRVTADD